MTATPADDVTVLPEVDTPPKSGVWVDHELFVPTPEEIALGNALGMDIDTADPLDDGGRLLHPGRD